VEKWKKWKKWKSGEQVGKYNELMRGQPAAGTQPRGFCFMRSVFFRAVLTDFAKILASSRAS
jgi:hypothetical protein